MVTILTGVNQWRLNSPIRQSPRSKFEWTSFHDRIAESYAHYPELIRDAEDSHLEKLTNLSGSS